jgi:hypothetical protein
MCILLDDNLQSLKIPKHLTRADHFLSQHTFFSSVVQCTTPLHMSQENQPIAGGSAIISVVHIRLLKP